MGNGLRIIPFTGDGVKVVEKIAAPTTSDIAYPVGTVWVDTLHETAYLHCDSGVWVFIGGSSGGGGDWGVAKSVTVSGGIITVESGCWYKVDTEGGAASDDLDTISGLAEGEQVMLSAANGARTIVLKTGTGNLNIRVNTSLNDTIGRVILVSDGTNLVEASSRP